MKVRSDMIIVGSLVTHSRSGSKGIVIKVDEAMRQVLLFNINAECWLSVHELEWTDDADTEGESGLSNKRVTVSKILLNQKVNDLLHRWCELAAANGGSFSVEQEWSKDQWWTTYTIEWPDGMTIPDGATA
jgi:hypothetical protein